jgi:acetyltransferase-like isoleucine patch superfamily enzyme
MSGNYFIKGRHTYGDPNIIWGEYHGGKVTTGAFCSIDSTSTFILGGNHSIDWVTTFPFMCLPAEFPSLSHLPDCASTKGDVTIGNDVWIGRNAVVMSGVNIADGCVLGACSVLAKDLPPYSIAVGNPARVVKKRFDEEQIESLMAIKWWDWPLDKIIDNALLLCSSRIDEFIQRHRP